MAGRSRVRRRRGGWGKGFEKPQPRWGNGFEKVPTKWSIGFENLHSRVPHKFVKRSAAHRGSTPARRPRTRLPRGVEPAQGEATSPVTRTRRSRKGIARATTPPTNP